MNSTLRSIVAALVIAALAFSSTARPAKADTTSTILITAAAAAALLTGINVAEKNAKANTVVGYLQNGSVVYADGHVVAPNGLSWYPGNAGENIACNGPQCVILVANGGYGYGYPVYAPGYGGYAPNYGGYAPGYGGQTYYGGNRTVNTVSTTTIVHREAPATPAPNLGHDKKPIRLRPDPTPPR